MAIYYRKSLSDTVKKLEKYEKKTCNPVLIIDMDIEGLYGPNKMTGKELNKYVKDKGYEVVIIDDIPSDNED